MKETFDFLFESPVFWGIATAFFILPTILLYQIKEELKNLNEKINAPASDKADK